MASLVDREEPVAAELADSSAQVQNFADRTGQAERIVSDELENLRAALRRFHEDEHHEAKRDRRTKTRELDMIDRVATATGIREQALDLLDGGVIEGTDLVAAGARGARPYEIGNVL